MFCSNFHADIFKPLATGTLKISKKLLSQEFRNFFPNIFKSSRASTDVQKCFAVTLMPRASSLERREILIFAENYYHRIFVTFFQSFSRVPVPALTSRNVLQ